MQGMDEAEVAKERTEALSMVSRRPLTVPNMKPTVVILILILILILIVFVFLNSFIDVDERFRVHHGFGIREEE